MGDHEPEVLHTTSGALENNAITQMSHIHQAIKSPVMNVRKGLSCRLSSIAKKHPPSPQIINLAAPSLPTLFFSSPLEWDSQCNYIASCLQLKPHVWGTGTDPYMGFIWEEGKQGHACGCSTAQQSLQQDIQHLLLPHTPSISSGMGCFLSICPSPDDLSDGVDIS